MSLSPASGDATVVFDSVPSPIKVPSVVLVPISDVSVPAELLASSPGLLSRLTVLCQSLSNAMANDPQGE